MAIARVQSAFGGFGGSVGGGGAGNPAQAVFGSNVTAGNLIVVFTRDFEGISVTITDTRGNTYTRHGGTESGTEPRMTVWSAVAASSGACTVEGTWDANQTYRWVFAVEFSPGTDTWSTAAATRLQTTGTNIGTGTSDMVSSAITTSAAGLLLMAVSENATVTYTAGTDFTLIAGNIGVASPVDERFGGAEEYIHGAALSSYTAHITSAGTAAYRTIWADFAVSPGGRIYVRRAIRPAAFAPGRSR